KVIEAHNVKFYEEQPDVVMVPRSISEVKSKEAQTGPEISSATTKSNRRIIPLTPEVKGSPSLFNEEVDADSDWIAEDEEIQPVPTLAVPLVLDAREPAPMNLSNQQCQEVVISTPRGQFKAQVPLDQTTQITLPRELRPGKNSSFVPKILFNRLRSGHPT
ncbi:unnamed protein product, partial [Allacma fusca]